MLGAQFRDARIRRICDPGCRCETPRIGWGAGGLVAKTLHNFRFLGNALSRSAVPPKVRVWGDETSFAVLGVHFAAIQIPEVIRKAEEWIGSAPQTRYITVSNVHSVIESHHNTQFRKALIECDMNVPDGMPIVWMGRSQGYKLPRRVYGPDLFIELCRATQKNPYRHFFYGGTLATLEMLIENLTRAFPTIQVAGHYSPPFRQQTEEDDRRAIEIINAAEADILWVGLGCPKQELWMHAHRNKLRVPVMIGIGQAFNIYAGKVRQAPRWMRDHGMEWLFRLVQEPRRLWRRYLIYNVEFMVRLLLASIR